MCGIVGFIRAGKTTQQDLRLHKKWFEQALMCDQVRGTDGTGAFLVDAAGKWKGYKKALNAGEALQLQGFKRLLSDMDDAMVAVGHNRASTKGADVSTNCHPFAEENIVLVHNGTLQGKGGLHLFDHGDNDSKYIARNVAKYGAEAVLPQLSGAFALVWYDLTDMTLHMARNDERPMNFIMGSEKDEELIMFGSEAPMLYWLAERNFIDLRQKYTITQPYVEYVFPIHSPFEVEERSFNKYKPAHSSPVVGMVWNGHNYTNRPNAPRYKRPDYPDDVVLHATVLFCPTAWHPYGGVNPQGHRTGTISGYIQSCDKDATQIAAKMYQVTEEEYDTMPDNTAVEITYVPHTNSRDQHCTVILSTKQVPDAKKEVKTEDFVTGNGLVGKRGRLLSKARTKELMEMGCYRCESSIAYKERNNCKVAIDTAGTAVGIICPRCHSGNEIKDGDIQKIITKAITRASETGGAEGDPKARGTLTVVK